MIIHTVTSLRRVHRRVETRLEKAQHVLRVMEAGASLHLQHTKQGPVWVLSNGTSVPDSIAKLVVASASVIGVGDALFAGVRSQTYRF